MPPPPSFVARYGRRIAAVVLVSGFYGLSRPVEPSADERAAMARRFAFRAIGLPEIPGAEMRSLRSVNPSFARIASWISAVGAGVALNDLDADGLPNDLCYVETRTDKVIVAPAPGTGARYAPFMLEPSPLEYDAATTAPMGCLPGDFDENGTTDLLVYYWGRTPIAFLAQAGATPGPTGASFVARDVVTPVERWYTNAATLADLDGDGHGDLVIGNYFPDGSRVLDAHATAPDHMQRSMSRAANGGRIHLLRWTPERFIDTGGLFDDPVALGWTLGVGAADLDGDLLPELYLARDFGPDRLLHNRSTPGRLRFALVEGRRGFTTPSSKVLGRDSHKGMSVDFGDVNGDGHLDICVSNIAEEYALEESHFLFVHTGDTGAMRRGVAPYVDRSEPLGISRGGWGWDCRFGDFDNDGTLEMIRAVGFLKGDVNRWPELHELAMGNDELLSRPGSWPRFMPGDDLSGHGHDRFFVRGDDGRFHDVARDVGIGEDQVTRGVATADVNGDGRLDFAVANQWEASQLYRNESPSAGAFLGLRLTLAADGVRRAAITASATVHMPRGKVATAQLDGGNGHSGKRSSDLHFGLGETAPSDSVSVDLRWRDERGALQHARLSLRPGWHSITLARGRALDGANR